jgi:cytoskeleton protein RodZ
MSEAIPNLESDAVRAPPLPGPQLAAAREGCGLSVADVARQLKLSPWQVEALETDNYARMPGTVFVRGFIRNYARLVKLDPAALLTPAPPQFSSPTHAAPELSPLIEIPFRSGRAIKWRKYAIAAMLLLVPVAIFEFYRGDVTEVAVKSRPIVLPQPQVVTEEPVEQTSVPAQASATNDAADKPARTESDLPRGEKTLAGKPLPAVRTATAEHNPGEHLVKLKFEREAWVEIRDRSGRRIFSQLNPAGTEQAVSGQPPLTLVVGNAAGVRVTHNDQSVDLAPYIQIDVARLTLE